MNGEFATIFRQVFPGLPEDDVRRLAEVAEVETFPAGAIVCHEGRMEEYFYVITSGQVEISKRFDDETQRTLHHLGPGEFFGEIALVQKTSRSATVRTLEVTSVLRIDHETFGTVLERSPLMALQIVRQVSARLRDADQQAIADLRRKNVELARAYAALEEQQRVRSGFLTTVSHELRTPLTTVSGYLHFLEQGVLGTEQQKQAVKTIARNVGTIVHLVNSILFLQELDMIRLDFQAVDVGEIVLKAVQRVWERAAESGIRLRVEMEPDLPPLHVDKMELQRAIEILLNNAIKFSPDGGEVCVKVFTTGDRVGVCVADPGVGIPAEELENIFEPFTQARSPEGRLFGGIGLGLPIARHVVELHGGSIEVQSRVGRGSEFTILLPTRQREHPSIV